MTDTQAEQRLEAARADGRERLREMLSSDTAGVFLRVSTGDQHEELQEPEDLRYCEQKGYRVGKIYRAHGKSAYKKGKLDKAWQEVVNDVKSGLINVVVLWKVNRLDRQNLLHAVPMVNMVLDAEDKAGRNLGARIEFVSQPMDLTTSPGRVAFAMYCEQAYQESKDKSDNVLNSFKKIDANKAFRGRKPYGYRVIGDKYKDRYDRHLLPDLTHDPNNPGTGEIRLLMVKWYLDGDTLVEIVNRLDGMRIPPPNHRKQAPGQHGWSVDTVRDKLTEESLIGKRHYADGTLYTFPPLLKKPDGSADMETWRRLQSLIKLNKRKCGSAGRPKGMLTDVAYCGKCKGVMHYRDTQKPGENYVWRGIRCDGPKKHPSKCKVSVTAKPLEDWVDLWFTESGPFADTEIVEILPVYDDRRDRIDDVDREIDALNKSAPDYLEKITALIAQRQAIENEPHKQGDGENPTGIKVGEYWPTLSAEEKRQYLLDSGVKVYVDKPNGQMEPWITGDPRRVLGTIKRKKAA